jgi:hypothetical protein
VTVSKIESSHQAITVVVVGVGECLMVMWAGERVENMAVCFEVVLPLLILSRVERTINLGVL